MLVVMIGLEPMTSCLSDTLSNQLIYITMLEPFTEYDPVSSVWKTEMLTNYTKRAFIGEKSET